MADSNYEEALLVRITEQQGELLSELRSQRRTGKDFWDRLTAISPIMSAAIIACIGAYFTYSYNQQQLKVQEIQTLERFIPHLVGDEKTKRAAILAISSMGNAPLAAKVAKIFASEGTASALRYVAETGDTKEQAVMREALYKTLDILGEKYKAEARTVAATSPEEPAASERPVVEAVHLKEPEPRPDANKSVEAEETDNQRPRATVAESTHTKQQ